MNNNIPIQKDLFILEIDKINRFNRMYPLDVVKQWIENIKNGSVPYYKIEFSYDLDENNFFTEYVSDMYYCGHVTDIYVEDKKVYGKAKFMINNIILNKIYDDPTLLEELSLTPKGFSYISKNTVCQHELIGFNLINKKRSPFFPKEEVK